MAIASWTPVKSGTYLNTKRFALTQVSNDGDALPGAAGEEWVRVPTAVAIAAAPILGGLFVVAFPFVGLATVAAGVARKLAGGVKDGAADLAANLSAGPVPGEAHLTGKPGEAGQPVAGEPSDPSLAALGKDIEAKRRP